MQVRGCFIIFNSMGEYGLNWETPQRLILCPDKTQVKEGGIWGFRPTSTEAHEAADSGWAGDEMSLVLLIGLVHLH